MVELRKRCQELSDEISRLNKEVNEIQQDNNLYGVLDKRYDLLVRNVRELEGDLADHNLTSDKLRTDTGPEEVHHMYAVMKQQNTEMRGDIDRIFLEKKSHEDEIQQMEEEIISITRAAEARLSELHPDQRAEYEDLREERGHLGQALAESREDLDQLADRLITLETRLRSDPLKSRAEQLTALRTELNERLEVLSGEVRQCSMPVAEQRELLLAKVKSDNAEIVAAEKRNSELKLENERLKAQMKEVLADTQEHKGDEENKQKHEILFAKDQEMSQFIASFDENKNEEEGKLKAKQDSIMQILANITKAVAEKSAADPETQMKDMEDELDFKSKQLQNAETTQNRLQGELAKRESELEKISDLDVKISSELTQVQATMTKYEEEIANKFDLIADFQADGSQRVKQLETRKAVLEKRAASLTQQVGFIKLKYKGKQQQLSENDVAQGLETQERKIQQYGQTL